MQAQKLTSVQQVYTPAFKKLDFFDTFSKKQDELFVKEYNNITRTQNFQNCLNKFDFIRRKIYEWKFDENFRKKHSKEDQQILEKEYLELVDQEFKDPRKLKGIYQVYKESILAQILTELIVLSSKVKVNTIQQAFLSCEVFELVATVKDLFPKKTNEKKTQQILNLAKSINQQLFQKVHQFYCAQYVRKKQESVQAKVNKALIQIKKHYMNERNKEEMKLFSLLDIWLEKEKQCKEIFSDLVKIQQQKQNQKKSVMNRNAGKALTNQELQIVQKLIHQSLCQSSILQTTLMLIQKQFQRLNEDGNQKQITKFQDILLRFHYLLQKNKSTSVTWLKYKASRLFIYIIGTLNPQTEIKPDKTPDLLIKHMKKQMDQRVALKTLCKIQRKVKNCQNFLFQKSIKKVQQLAKLFQKQYSQTKKSCIQSLNSILHFYSEINSLKAETESFKFSDVCRFESYSKSLYLNQANESDQQCLQLNCSQVGKFILGVVQKTGAQLKFIIPRFKHIQCFLRKYFQLPTQVTQNTFKYEEYDQHEYIHNNISQHKSFEENLPYLILIAIKFAPFNPKQFQFQSQNTTNNNKAQKKANQHILQCLKIFSNEYDGQYQQISQILDFYERNLLVQAWTAYKSFSVKDNKSQTKQLKIFSTLEEIYTKTVLQKGQIDFSNTKQLKQIHKAVESQIQFSKFKEMFMILNYLTQAKIHQDEVLQIQNEKKWETNNMELREYVKHFTYTLQEQEYEKYVVNLENHPYYGKISKEQFKKVEKNLQLIRLTKCLTDEHKIVSIKSVKREIVIVLKVIRTENFTDMQRTIRMAIRKYKKMIEEKNLNEVFPFWYIYFNQFTFKIIKKENQKIFDILINPYEPFLMSLLLERQVLQKKYLKDSYPNYPFIHLSNIFEKQRKDNSRKVGAEWFEYEEPQFQHLIKQMKILSIQQTNFIKNSLKILSKCPFLWSAERKVVEIITFKEKYQLQINLQEARRKKNQINQKKIELLLQKKIKQKESCKKTQRQKLSSLQQDIQRLRIKLEQHNPVDGRRVYNEKKRNGLLDIDKDLLDDIDKIPEYQYGNNFNVASQGLYAIEGVMQKSAFQQGIFNYTGTKNNFVQDESAHFSRFEWADRKEDIKEMILQVADKEDKRTLKKHQKDGYFKITFASFQTFLRFIRNICAHYVFCIQNGIKRQRTFQQKIKIIQKNFPKLFNFLYQWRQVIGKLISIDERKKDENEQSSQKKEFKTKPKQNKTNNEESKQNSNEEVPIFQEDDINKEFNKTLAALFPLSGSGNSTINKCRIQRLRKLKQLEKYNKISVRQKFPYNQKGKYLCQTCLSLRNAIYTIECEDQDSKGKAENFWEFLNNLGTFSQKAKNKPFNILFMKHQGGKKINQKDGVQADHICCWELDQQTWFAFFNTMKRKKIQPEELDMMQDQEQKVIEDLQKWKKEQYNFLNSDTEQETNPNLTQSEVRWGRGRRAWNLFQKVLDNKDKLKNLQEKLKKTDYMGKMFIFELLGKYPLLLNDIRYTRHKWDETVLKQEVLRKQF